MTKLLFINWECGKLRLQFCVGEIDITAGAAVVLLPCCPLFCVSSGRYLILYWAVSVCELSRKLFAFFFFFSPGYFSASWAHWNQLGAGSDKHWNQHKAAQKSIDCRKDVNSFISLGCLDFFFFSLKWLHGEYGEVYLNDFWNVIHVPRGKGE